MTEQHHETPMSLADQIRAEYAEIIAAKDDRIVRLTNQNTAQFELHTERLNKIREEMIDASTEGYFDRGTLNELLERCDFDLLVEFVTVDVRIEATIKVDVRGSSLTTIDDLRREIEENLSSDTSFGFGYYSNGLELYSVDHEEATVMSVASTDH